MNNCEGMSQDSAPYETERALPCCGMKLSEAWDCEKEIVPLSKAQGRISAGFLALYPPGIPLIIPGEVFDRELIETFEKYLDLGLNLQGIFVVQCDGNKGIMDIDKRGVLCVRQR